MKKATTSEKVVAWFFLGIIIFICCFILLRVFTRQVLVKHYGISNGFTDIVLFDAADLNGDEEDGEDPVYIDWAALYPFDGTDVKEEAAVTEETEDEGPIDAAKNKILGIEDKIDYFATNYMPWHRNITELANGYENILQWNIVSYNEYNGITQVDGNYLAVLTARMDMSEVAESTIEFSEYCRSKGINFLYAMQPSKICVSEDENISGYTDFSNQNMDEFLALVSEAGVDVYDHRADIHSEGNNHHDMFYSTDHHWKCETGLWAARHLLDFMNEKYGYDFDSSLLDEENFEYEVYEDWFLGSQGKKVTLGVVDPEDIALLHPKFETKLHYEILSLGLDEQGTLDITYNMEEIEEKDYYNNNPYRTYDYADHALKTYENLLIEDGPRVLIIHNSFANCEIPFMALGIKYVDELDLRYFTGSVKSYIEQNMPDVVIVTYSSPVGTIDWSTHTDLFDFR